MHFSNYAARVLLASVGLSAGTKIEQQTILSPSEHDVFSPGFDSFVEDTLNQLHIPGLSIAVIDNGNIASKVITREWPSLCRNPDEVGKLTERDRAMDLPSSPTRRLHQIHNTSLQAQQKHSLPPQQHY